MPNINPTTYKAALVKMRDAMDDAVLTGERYLGDQPQNWETIEKELREAHRDFLTAMCVALACLPED